MTDATRDLIQRLVNIADTLDGRKPLVFSQGQAMDGFTALANFQALANEARALLSQPVPEEPTVMEIIALADEIEAEGLGQVDLVRRALARWGRPAVEPVPVSERPWERDGWCDGDGWCWVWNAGNCQWWEWIDSALISFAQDDYTHSLPHYALLVPTTTEKP